MTSQNSRIEAVHDLNKTPSRADTTDPFIFNLILKALKDWRFSLNLSGNWLVSKADHKQNYASSLLRRREDSRLRKMGVSCLNQQYD